MARPLPPFTIRINASGVRTTDLRSANATIADPARHRARNIVAAKLGDPRLGLQAARPASHAATGVRRGKIARNRSKPAEVLQISPPQRAGSHSLRKLICNARSVARRQSTWPRMPMASR